MSRKTKLTIKPAMLSTLVAVAGLAAGTQSAMAGVEYYGSHIYNTRVSGESRGDHQIFNVAMGGMSEGYIASFAAAEKRDEPCWLDVQIKSLPGASVSLNNPIGFGCANSTVRSHKRLAVPNGKYITGVRMCRRDGNTPSTKNLMKGLEIKLGRLKSNNSLAAAGTMKFKRPNCKKWSAWSNCPNGSILIDVRAHMRASPRTEKGSVVGLQSSCRKIRNN